MSAVVLTSSPCALRFIITTANQTHESRLFVVMHNKIWTANGLFCLPEGRSYDTDVTIHLNIPDPTINTKKRLLLQTFQLYSHDEMLTLSRTQDFQH